MKNIPKFLVLCSIFFFSCNLIEYQAGQRHGDSGISYNDSKNLWADLKEVNGDSYTYTVKFISWAGFGWNTTIKVEEGQVSERYYEAFVQKYEGGEYLEEITETYTETGDELGFHETGAEPLTIDELYEICISEYLVVNEAENAIYFNTTDAGVISECGYVPDNCADDCFIGFQILEFEWL